MASGNMATSKKKKPSKAAAPVDFPEEARRRARETYERLKEAEFRSRHERWAASADRWARDWAHGGREQARRAVAEATRLRLEEDRWEADRERPAAASLDERTRDAERRRARSADQVEQFCRDRAYADYLGDIGAQAEQVAEMLRSLTAWAADRDYGTGDKKVFHRHVPPPSSGARVFRYDRRPDPFPILGLGRGATREQVKVAYRKLSLAHHPDRGGDERSFIRIKIAYDQCLELCDRGR